MSKLLCICAHCQLVLCTYPSLHDKQVASAHAPPGTGSKSWPQLHRRMNLASSPPALGSAAFQTRYSWEVDALNSSCLL